MFWLQCGKRPLRSFGWLFISIIVVIVVVFPSQTSGHDSLDSTEDKNGRRYSVIPDTVAQLRKKRQISSTEKPPVGQESQDTAKSSNHSAKLNKTSTYQSKLFVKKSAKIPSSNSTSLLTTDQVHYDVRDVSYYLESHSAHSINDPRSYFTEERATSAMMVILNDVQKIPKRLRFAFVARSFHELGRKLASKFNLMGSEVEAILEKTPDDLGNKPEVSSLVDAIERTLDSKEDKHSTRQNENSITLLNKKDPDRASVMEIATSEVSRRLGRKMAYVVNKIVPKVIGIKDDQLDNMCKLLGEAMMAGAKTLIDELKEDDRHRITQETTNLGLAILMKAKDYFKTIAKSKNVVYPRALVNSQMTAPKDFKNMNPIATNSAMKGPWNSYLFSNLGSAERVMRVYSDLLSRIPLSSKTRWMNIHYNSVNNELKRTMSGFVVMQGMPYQTNTSEIYLLDPLKSVQIVPNKSPELRANYTSDKNRMPARCYLAGRRWRLMLTRALKDYDMKDATIDKISAMLINMKRETVQRRGYDIYRLCLPRVEVGVRGLGINGEPADAIESSRFSLKNPIENINRLDNPFASGVRLGYKLGFKVGYNEERNATLEIENAGQNDKSPAEKVRAEVSFLAKAAYRKAASSAAKEAFSIALHDGYLTTLKVSPRAGLLIPSETGSKLAALKATGVASQLGSEAGKAIADSYITSKGYSEQIAEKLLTVGERFGLLAGQNIGELIGSIVGKEAAEEAYKRHISRGGKVSRAKFHFDEFQAGGEMGFELGMNKGKSVASSSTLDPAAPKSFKFVLPVFKERAHSDYDVDHWEKDLMPPLTIEDINGLQAERNHTGVTGIMRGHYRIVKETKKGLKRVSYQNSTYHLEVHADGFISNNVAFLTLNGTINNQGPIYGSLIARDIFNEYDR